MATRTELLARLPTLPAAEAPRLPQHTLAGLNTGVRDPRRMTDPARNPNPGIFNPSYITILDPNHDVLRDGNVVRRRLMTFTQGNDGFRHRLNTALGGGETSPVLVTALGIATGLVSGGAGIAFSVLATGIDMQRVNQPVRARMGDAVDLIEVMGKRGTNIFSWTCYALVDPLRAQALHTPFQWVIHGELQEVTIQ